jgi:hypothetical protein
MKGTITTRSVVTKAPEQVACDMGGEAVMLNMQSGVYYGTDDIGALVWNLLDEPRSVEAIRDTILEQYSVDADRCEQDLLAFLNEMEAAGLVEIQDDIETPSRP